jgi:hypothetical protein
MKPHPLTLSQLDAVALRPGMYMRDYDLRELEMQLNGFDAGLAAAGVLGQFDRFNQAFNDFLRSNTNLSCSQGWATAMLEKHGQSQKTFSKFLQLVKNACSEGGAA